MSIKRYANGAWQDVTSIKRYSSGAWREITEGKSYKNGAWETIWPEGVTIEVLYSVFGDANVFPSVRNGKANIIIANAIDNAETLATAEIRVLLNGNYVVFGEGFTVEMSIWSEGKDETFFRYDTGKTSEILYMEYDTVDDCYYGYIKDSIPLNCKRIYVGNEGDDVILKGRIGAFIIDISSSVTKIKDIICRDMYS